MATVEASEAIAASPEAVWRIVLGYEQWPEWSPLFQRVVPESPEIGLNGEWTLNGLIGRMPYTGLFRQIDHRPLERFIFASIRVSPPYDFIRHSVFLTADGSPPRLTWRIDYKMSGGPGGWIIDRLLVRRGVDQFLGRMLTAISEESGAAQEPRSSDRADYRRSRTS